MADDLEPTSPPEPSEPPPETAAPEPPAPAAAAPGWYPDGQGSQRYWDGDAWTDHMAPATTTSMDPKTAATLVHVGGIFLGFISPLVGYLALPNDEFVRAHSRNALNFHITLLIAYVIATVLVFVLIGILLFLVLFVGSVVLQIMGAIAASRGEHFSYPFTYEFISR